MQSSVQSLLLQPNDGEGEVENFREFLKKNTILNKHPVRHTSNNMGPQVVGLLGLLYNRIFVRNIREEGWSEGGSWNVKDVQKFD